MTELGLLARIAVLKHFIGGRSPEWVAEVEGVTVAAAVAAAARHGYPHIDSMRRALTVLERLHDQEVSALPTRPSAPAKATRAATSSTYAAAAGTAAGAVGAAHAGPGQPTRQPR